MHALREAIIGNVSTDYVIRKSLFCRSPVRHLSKCIAYLTVISIVPYEYIYITPATMWVGQVQKSV